MSKDKIIPSFKINHLKLLPGIYVSMKRVIGEETITTFDIRLCRPYKDNVLDTGVVHSIEHVGATYLRKISKHKNDIIYFGPMGCRTGFYLIILGNYESFEIKDLIIELFQYLSNYKGDTPGASKLECGNCEDMDLEGAKQISTGFLKNTLVLLTEKNLIYPK